MHNPSILLRAPQGLRVLRPLPVPSHPTRPGAPLRAAAPLPARGLSAAAERARQAWERLAAARGANPEVLRDLLVVLIETAPDDDAAPLDLATPRLAAPPEPHRATAAHPRAYRGTHARPPRARLPPAVDLRPFLGERRHLGPLLRQLAPHLDQAALGLIELGYPIERVEALCRQLRRSPGGDPALAFHFGIEEELALPVRFGLLLPHLRGQPASEVRAWASLHRSLELDRRSGRLEAVLDLLESGSLFARAWCERTRALPEMARTPFLELVRPSGAARCDPAALDASMLGLLSVVPGQKAFCARAGLLLAGLARGLSHDFLRLGLHLAARPEVGARLEAPAGGGDVEAEVLARVVAQIEPAESARAWLAFNIWRCCGELPGLGELLAREPWPSLGPDAADHLLMAARETQDGVFSEEARRARWSALRPLLPRLVREVAELPPAYQGKAARLYAAWLRWWEAPQDFARLLNAGRPLVEVTCREGFSTDADAGIALSWLVERLPEAALARVASARHALQRLEHATARDNDARLIQRGFEALTGAAPSLVAEAFLAFPSKLMRVARLLGVLSRAEARRLVETFARHPAVVADPLSGSLEEVCARLAPLCQGEVAHPVPRAVRAALGRGEALGAERRARALREARAALPLTRLQLLEAEALAWLGRGLDADVRDPRAGHALRLAAAIDTNRRALRRFLRGHFAGAARPLAEHPANAAWARRHPRLHLGTWLAARPHKAVLPVLGQVELALEADPLEVLRLGTHVGSCLGLGGICDYSAAAVALDLNKRVAYARDARGRVVGRQVLAITEADELVCFHVYPQSAPEGLRELFRRYDLELARALGLPLAGASYDVANLVSSGWWDDGAWELAQEPAPVRAGKAGRPVKA